MTPLQSTLIISALMLVLSLLPLQLRAIRSHSKLLFLTGTGALIGLLVFDLVPDVIALGGRQSLVWIGLVWAIYSLFHLVHVHHHSSSASTPAADAIGKPAGSERIGAFLFAISVHCFSSGMMLAVSDEFTAGFQRAVFLALLAHKTFEALTVSSIVAEKVPRKPRAVTLLVLYSLSLPLGESVAAYYRASITPQLVVIVTCVATGSLLGCLYSDFLLPSLIYLRARKWDAAWLVGGLVVTELMIRTF